jgi:hypothetical protein
LHGTAAGIAGINPFARLMIVKALNNFGHTRASSCVAEAINVCVDNGMRVLNLSLGGKRSARSNKRQSTNPGLRCNSAALQRFRYGSIPNSPQFTEPKSRNFTLCSSTLEREPKQSQSSTPCSSV